MRLNIRTTAWLALLLAALVAGTAVADDRDFLRQLAAPPNLIFILDTSRSMVGSPEEPGKVMNARVGYGMVPGGGDDPYSRMGIAKRVLREFLTDVSDANYVLAGYAQAPPADGSSPIPTKHWVYEGIGHWDSTLGDYRPDHFHLMEKGYAYRFGYAETYAGLNLDNPADIYQGTMMGYTPYFDPALGAAGVENRFGPVRAYDFDPTLPYDLMPIYFGNCIYDDVKNENLCGDGVFPFYDTGERDASGNKITEEWYYGESGRFPHCVPWKSSSPLAPDDGCLAAWEDNTGTIPGYGRNRVEFKRRVRLEIPVQNPNTGLDNHPLGVLDSDGMSVGNELVNDLGTEDYDLDGTPDRDYDEDMAYDWVLYVDSVEQLSMRACGSPQTPPTATPTPLPLDCADLFISNPGGLQRGIDNRPDLVDRINMDVGNNTPYRAYLTRTTITWADTQSQSGSPYIDRLFFEGNCWNEYWQGDEYGSPATVVPPYAAGGGGICGDANTSFNRGDNRTDWFAYLNGGSWVGNVCVQLDFYFPDDPATQTCVVNDCINLSLTPPTATPTPRDTNTPTNTPIPPTPTNTRIPPTPTNTFTPGPPTNTFTPAPPTNTPRDTNTPTNTPIPPTRTNTSPPTNTPTNTPIPPTPTNTPTPTPEIE